MKTLFTLLALASGSLFALQISTYNATLHERFSSGFPASPVPNIHYQHAHIDLSGIGWRDNDTRISVTLISPQHIVTAAHARPMAGTTVSFLSRKGDVYTATILESIILNIPSAINGEDIASDLAVCTLAEAIPEYAEISHHPILNLSSNVQAYLSLQSIIYGQKGRTGENLWFAQYTPSESEIFSGLLFGMMAYNPNIPNSAQGETGDSGSPTLLLTGRGTLALLGIHSAIGTLNTTPVTFDTPVFQFKEQLSSILASKNQVLDNYYLSESEYLVYAFTPNMTTSDGETSHLPQTYLTENNTLETSFTPYRSTLTYTVELSTDLQSWVPLFSTNNTLTQQKVESPLPVTDTPRQFIRVRVSSE